MRTFILFLLSAFLLLSCNDQRSKQKNEKPNILFIAVDDLKPLLGCYGDTTTYSPNIDELANRGFTFLNNHCQVSVCGASRASLLTGLYADQTKVWGFDTIRKHNPGIVTLPQHFKKHGYKTINYGKIFDYRTVDKYSDSISWDYVYPVTEDDYYPHYNKDVGIAALYHYQSDFVKQKYQQYKNEALAAGKDSFKYAFKRISPAYECIDVPDDAYKDGIFSKLAVDKIHELGKSQDPFFLAVGFHKPHLPFVAPKKYWDLYNRDKIKLAEYQKMADNPVEYAYHNSSELRKYTDEKGNHIYEKLKDREILDLNEQAKLIHAYKATVSFVDAQVGKLIQALKDQDLYNNTIIVFWGDHGFHLGDHNMWGKVTNFEQATRSPLVVAAPGLEKRATHNPSEFVDIYPTLCEMAGLPMPAHLEGTSLTDRMNGKSKNKYAISQFMRGDKMVYAIRTKKYRYVAWVKEGLHANQAADLTEIADEQLFDYTKDPLETMNLADKKGYEHIIMDHKNKLFDFFERTEVLNRKN
jgi:arylsulfatase A-like enzyme